MSVEKALVAMSGGVDSSVAAYLMQKSGYACAGATLRLHDASLLGGSACGSDADAEDARRVAERLKMPFYLLDAADAFREHVVEHFVRSYESGLTPNPCVECNRYLKFAELLKRAASLGYDTVATGHYARIRRDDASGRYLLQKASDTAKDQTYFLACLTQHQLAHTVFPLGELTKGEVRKIAAEQGFLNARKRDSQDICFVPDGDYAAFLERYTKKHYDSGDFLDLEGNVVGRHRGAVCYTVGQRRGLGLAMGTPVYVCGKDMARNTVTVGTNEQLFSHALRANGWNWICVPSLTEPTRVCAKVRSRHEEQPAVVYPEPDGYARVEFDTPQRAVTPGQAVVLYSGDTVFGAGTITQAL